MKNLENIEQKTLSFLKQVSDPLVPIDKLVEFLRGQQGCEGVDEKLLLDFLRGHELFDVVEPAINEMLDNLSEAALLDNPHPVARVILTTRVPTQRQMAGMMTEQVQVVIDSLNKALISARDEGDQATAHKLIEIMSRARELQSRIAAHT